MMTKRPVAWILLALLSAASAAAAYRYFPQAFSILSLEIAMDRDGALEAAREFATRDGLGPDDYRQAASFGIDEATQTFVELEGGGKPVLTAMMRDGLYSAYTWRVRHFRDGETTETMFYFRPDGRPYGFFAQLPEDLPGATLDAEDARELAETQAVAAWDVDLAPFDLVEQAQERKLGGRLDHTFTYERRSQSLNEGRYRLRLNVAGDALTGVTHFVQIPEAFSRRYDSMRAANEAIGVGSVVGMTLLYVVGGIGVGLFFMMRRRWVIWRPAIVWGVAIAGLQALATLNDLPLLWMSYDTALPYSTFFLQQIAVAFATFVGFAGFFALSFAAAETLTRRAFGSHPQFWKLWGRQAGASTAALGGTVGGYLLVAVFLVYDVALYIFATNTLGWWTPSEALLHPDVLASYLPWLGAIANSVQAGFWEECLFRAVPIAGAALIGDRFGKRGLFIVIAFIVQAVVFGAGHAPYPTQPSFARPLELMLPSIGFGLLYLYFGLLPAIVLHFTFDVVWFALPIFASTAPGAWVQQVIVVAVTFVPLWILLWRRMQAGRWTPLAAVERNAAWEPPGVPDVAPVEETVPSYVLAPRIQRVWLGLGAASLAPLILAVTSGSTPPGLAVSRDDASRTARTAFEARGASLGPAWRLIAVPQDGGGVEHEFVSETAGEARRLELVGRYLSRPRWWVRAATFEGDVADRAEEWRAYVWSADEVGFLSHRLPEGRPGGSLDEAAARALALDTVRTQTALEPARGDVREVSARPTKLAARTDWEFIFADTTVDPLPEGEPRVSVRIAGDEVVSTGRFIHIPEDWTRDKRAAGIVATVVQIGASLLFAAVLVTGAALGVRDWSRRAYTPWLFAASTGLMTLVTLATAANNWPTVLASFLTAQSVALQLVIVIGGGLVAVVALASLIGLVVGALPRWIPAGRLPEAEALRLGAVAGLVGAAVLAGAGWLQVPVWAGVPDLSPLGSQFPGLQLALGPVGGVLTRTALLLALLVFVTRMTQGWTRRRGLAAAVLLAVGFLAVASPVGPALGWVAAGLFGGIALLTAYVTLFRADLTIVPIALGVMAVVGLLVSGLERPFPGALLGSFAGALVAVLVAWWLFKALRRP